MPPVLKCHSSSPVFASAAMKLPTRLGVTAAHGAAHNEVRRHASLGVPAVADGAALEVERSPGLHGGRITGERVLSLLRGFGLSEGRGEQNRAREGNPGAGSEWRKQHPVADIVVRCEPAPRLRGRIGLVGSQVLAERGRE